MKFCHSLLSKPFLSKGLANFESLIWMSALSLRCLKDLNQSVTLYADKISINIIKNLLDYDEFIEVTPDEFIPSNCYAASKFYALQLMGKDDIHIDNDVLIDSKLCIDLLYKNTADVVTQMEYTVGQYKFESSLEAVTYLKILGIIPQEFEPTHGFNNGVICIRDEKFKNDYVSNYFNILKNYNEDISNFDASNLILDSFIEELSLYNMCMFEGRSLKIYTLLGDVTTNEKLNKVTEKSSLLKYQHYCGPKDAYIPHVKSQLKLRDLAAYNRITKFMNSTLLNGLLNGNN